MTPEDFATEMVKTLKKSVVEACAGMFKPGTPQLLVEVVAWTIMADTADQMIEKIMSTQEGQLLVLSAPGVQERLDRLKTKP